MKTNPGASPLPPTKFHSGLAKPATLLSPLPGANLFNTNLGCRICNQQGLRSCLRLPGPCRAGFQQGFLSLCTTGPHRLANNSLLLVPRLGVGAWESLKAAKYSFPRGWFISLGPRNYIWHTPKPYHESQRNLEKKHHTPNSCQMTWPSSHIHTLKVKLLKNGFRAGGWLQRRLEVIRMELWSWILSRVV